MLHSLRSDVHHVSLDWRPRPRDPANLANTDKFNYESNKRTVSELKIGLLARLLLYDDATGSRAEWRAASKRCAMFTLCGLSFLLR